MSNFYNFYVPQKDFEVVFHRFLLNTDVPKDSKGITEYKYLSKDCFHLSQLGHARTANAYWNSMLTPASKRLTYWEKEFETFRCPTAQNPYLFTTKNSWLVLKKFKFLRKIKIDDACKKKLSLCKNNCQSYSPNYLHLVKSSFLACS